jgi:putative DNA primase/helicase
MGSAIILANEDDSARTIRPRLDAAGADVTKVHIVQGVSREGQAEPDFFQLDTDIRELRIKTQQIGDVRLIIIDPPSSYLGTKVDSYKDSDVRRVLTPLGTLAQETGALVLLVVHLNKRTDGGAQQRIGGSTAWVAAPRVAFLAIEDQNTKERFILPVKNNLGDDRTGFQYQIREKLIDYGDQTIKAPYIEWLSSTQRSAHELLDPPKQGRTSVVDDAKTFLEDELAVDAKSVTELKESAKSAGISWASVQRAKKALVISTKKVADGWEWQLLAGGGHV